MYISPEVKHRIHHLLALVIFLAGVFGIFYSVQAYPEIFRIEAKIEKEKEVGFKEPVVINFSEPMLNRQTEDSISLNPAEEVDFFWSDNNKALAVRPQKFWKPESGYRIILNGAKSLLLTSISKDLVFTTDAYPQVTEFYPASGEKDVLLDIEDPITAKFDKPIGDFRIKFIIRPYHDLAYEVNEEGNEVKLMAKEELRRGQKYEFDVWARYREESEENYQKIYSASFETKPQPPENWEKDLNLRLEQARRLTEPKISEGKYIDINVKSQVMTIFENGKLLDAYLVSTGKRSMPTPQGTFHITNKTPRAWSKKYGLYMPYWNAVVPSGDFGIHELPEWPGGYKEGQFHLGIPVSHGCIRLGVGPAQRVYEWAPIGTAVVIHE